VCAAAPRAQRRKRFRALVTAHGWRAASERHFGSAAKRLLAAAAAGARNGGTAAGAAVALPPPHEWRCLYKLLTLVPWSTISAGTPVDVAPLCRRGAASARGATGDARACSLRARSHA
jgi:hypothetical protein